MKKGAFVINNSREKLLMRMISMKAMEDGQLEGTAIDVFENEPYTGKLIEIARCLLTAHMASMSIDCRS
jgi:D-3-phosphoglycerate dehydrogenase / 2-oxoglutarate reductase